MRHLWKWSPIALVLCACVLYVIVGARAPDNFQNDSAYYFGVARHIALTGRIEEPIVWQFLRPPATIVHPAFDYWGGLTSLVLAPMLAVFGATQHVAFIAMALISAASVVALYALVSIVAPMRQPLLQLLAITVFALSPGMAVYRFDTESVALYQLLLLLALIAFARQRYALAVLGAAGVFFTRPDGLFVFAAVLIASVVMLRRKPPDNPRRAWGWLLGAAGGAACLYVAYNLLAFGTVTTQASHALFLFQRDDLYAFGVHPAASLDKLKILLSWKYVSIRLLMIVQALRISRLVPYPDVWLGVSLVTGLLFVRRNPPVVTLIWATLFPSLFLVIWSEPAVFAPWRSFHPLLPLLVLAGCYGLDAVALCVKPWAEQRRVRVLLGAALLALLCGVVVAKLSIYTARPRATNHDEIVAIRALDPVLAGRPVASDLPWYVIANTSSPAISIPGNGEAAMIAAFEKYPVQWLLFRDPHSSTAGSRRTLDAIARGEQRALGPLRLERVPAAAGVQLFRVRR